MDGLFLNSNHLEFPKCFDPPNQFAKKSELSAKFGQSEASREVGQSEAPHQIWRHEQDFTHIWGKYVTPHAHLAGGEGVRFWQDGWIWDVPISRIKKFPKFQMI